MDHITAVRSQVHLQAPAAQPASVRPVAGRSTPPVTDTIRPDAVLQPGTTVGLVSAQLADKGTDTHPASVARAAAEAARDAYIRASIAAGLSPLPLP